MNDSSLGSNKQAWVNKFLASQCKDKLDSLYIYNSRDFFIMYQKCPGIEYVVQGSVLKICLVSLVLL
jgi:hypothetical protein